MLPPVVAEIRANASQFTAEMGKVKLQGESTFGGLAGIGKVAMLGIAAAAVGGGIAALKMGGDFQMAMTQLVTGAGESRSNIDMVSKGILAMAGDTGTAASQLAQGMYMVESAGYHGAEGLNVLKAATEGARVGAADMATVADGLTTVLNAYKLPATQATVVTSQLVATVAAGKMHMEDLTSALGAIVPIAASLNVPFDQVSGAIATMTAQGTNATTATQSLRFLMASLAGPTAAAAKEFKGLGIGMDEIPGITKSVSDEISKLGLHTSAVAAELAKGDFTGAMKMITDAIGKQFPAGSAQYEAALRAAVGGTRGMTAALELSGTHAVTWAANIGSISGAAKGAGKDVQGWGDVQKDFNFQVAQAVEGTKALITEIGLNLIPYATGAMHAVAGLAGWLKQHKEVAIILAGAIGGVLLVAIAAYTVAMISAAVATIAATWPILAIVAGAMALGAGFVWAYNNIKPFHDLIQRIGDAFGAFFSQLQTGAGVFVGIEAFLYKMGVGAQDAGRAVDVLRSIWPAIVGAITTAWSAITGAFNAGINFVMGIVGPPLAAMSVWWKQHGAQVITVVSFLWTAVSSLFKVYLAVIGAAVGIWWAVVTGVFRVAWNSIAGIVKLGWDVVSGIFKVFVDMVTGTVAVFWDLITGLFTFGLDVITGHWGQAWHDLLSMFGNIGKDITNAVRGLWNDIINSITGFIGDVGVAAAGIGKAIVDGIVNGLKAAWSGLVSVFTSLAKTLPGPVQKVLGISSPSAVFAAAVGLPIAQGWAKGIADNAGLVHAAIGGVAGGLPAPSGGGQTGGGSLEHFEKVFRRGSERDSATLEAIRDYMERAVQLLAHIDSDTPIPGGMAAVLRAG
jgi:TP901 family phage tail tape measure protein